MPGDRDACTLVGSGAFHPVLGARWVMSALPRSREPQVCDAVLPAFAYRTVTFGWFVAGAIERRFIVSADHLPSLS